MRKKSALISGREEVYAVEISPQAEVMVRDLLHTGRGSTMCATIEQLVGSWLAHHTDEFDLFGLNYADAERKGYVPVRRRHSAEEVKDFRSGNKWNGTYRVKLYGLGVYAIDEFLQSGLYGTCPAEVVQRLLYCALENEIAEGNISRCSGKKMQEGFHPAPDGQVYGFKNGRFCRGKHIAAPTSVSQIRRDLGITKRVQRSVERAFQKAGVKI